MFVTLYTQKGPKLVKLGVAWENWAGPSAKPHRLEQLFDTFYDTGRVQMFKYELQWKCGDKLPRRW